MSAFDVIVIGAGANGLVAASALARKGLRTLVLERGETSAGQATRFEFAPGFRAAPLALDAGWVPPIVSRGLGFSSPDRVQPDIPFTVATGAGEFLTLPRDPVRARDAIRLHSQADASKWPALIARLRKLAGFLEELYQQPAPDIDSTSVREALPLLRLGRKLRALGRQDMIELLRVLPMSVQQLAEDNLESPALRAALAAAGVRDIRQGPRSGGTGFVLLHHMVGAADGSPAGRGVWRDGPGAFAAAVERNARQHGATLRTSAPVARVEVKDDAVTGVVLDNGEEIAAKRVVSALDPARTFGLIDPVWLDPELLLALRNIRYRGCTSYVLYGLNELPDIPGMRAEDVLRGTLSLSPDTDTLERAADAAKYGAIPERPHIEITAPSLHWPDLAPAGRHVVIARVQFTPYELREHARWDAARTTTLAESVTRTIESAIPCFTSRIAQRAALSPADIEERFGLTEGAATHGELGLDQILFMRPVSGMGRYTTPIEGLFLCGAGTHPGPGVPGGPGWLAARVILR